MPLLTLAGFRASYLQDILAKLCGMHPSRRVGIKNMAGRPNRSTGRREPASEKNVHELPNGLTARLEMPKSAKKPGDLSTLKKYGTI